MSLALAAGVCVFACFSDPSGEFETGEAATETGCAGEVDECGVCEGPGGPCLGCTVPGSSNFNALAVVDDGSCVCNPSGGQAVDQAQGETNVSGGGTLEWQSFTAELSGGLKAIDINMSSPLQAGDSPATLTIMEGEGPAGTELGKVEITIAQMSGFQSFTLDPPIPVAAERQYTFQITIPAQDVGYMNYSTDNPYLGGRAGGAATDDLAFRTYVGPCAPQ